MKKYFSRKILGLAMFILFAFLLPKITSAQSLGFSGGSSNAVLNQTFQITVTTSNNKQGVIINLQTLDAQKSAPISWVTVSPFTQQCTTGSNGSCVFSLTPKQVGGFHLAASVPAGGYQSVTTGSPITVAGALTISANPPNPKQNQSSIILVQTSDNKPNVPITFTGAVGFLTSQTCTTSLSGACSVTFNSPTLAPLSVTASAPNYSNATVNLSFGSCTIQSARFTPSGAQADSWFKDSAKPLVRIDVTGSNCANQTVEISITEKDNLTPDDDIAELDNRPITFDSNGTFSLTMLAGETDCEQVSDPDCEYYISVYRATGGDFNSHGQPAGNLTYQCSGLLCDTSWENATIVGPTTPSSPTSQANTSTYIPLVPLPDPNSASGATLSTIDLSATTQDPLANYLNIMIKLLIGMAAVFAVVMIVWGGIEYMMTELVGEKAAAKSRIMDAILGLLLALGAWIILNEINPKILNTGFNLAGTSIQAFEDETELPPTSSSFSFTPPSGALNLCPQGVSRVATSGGTFVACSSINVKLQSMVNAAWSQGVKLGGWGWRSASQQIALRVNHCGSGQYNTYEKPANQCRPPTARPGASRHESGVAVDFTCNEGRGAVLIQHPTNSCFLWLKQNASRYGFSNLSTEPWHWSIDGK